MEDKRSTDVLMRENTVKVPEWLYRTWILPQANRRDMTPDQFVKHVLTRMYAQILHETVPAECAAQPGTHYSYRWIELTGTQQTHN